MTKKQQELRSQLLTGIRLARMYAGRAAMRVANRLPVDTDLLKTMRDLQETIDELEGTIGAMR